MLTTCRYIVALVFGVVLLVAIVPGSWYVKNRRRR